MTAATVRFPPEAILEATGGVARVPAAGGAGGVSTDSRTVAPGDLFVALSGPRERPVVVARDGHGFAGAALERGAWGVLAEDAALADGTLEGEVRRRPGRALVAVPDTLRALGDLAAWQRRRMPARVVAITGSNGKTTTRLMAAAIAAARWRTLATEGNLNNLIGLPLTLLRLEAAHEVAVVELGMNHPGEIRRLAAIASPAVGVVTNVGPVHLEGVGGIEGVAAAKAEILEGIEPGGAAVLNADDGLTPKLAARWRGRVVRFGLDPAADVRAEGIEPSDGATRFTLVLPDGARGPVAIGWLGEHNVRNALAAAAALHCLGAGLAQVRAGLAAARPAAMRFEAATFAPGVTVVNDAYNANPASMRAALASLRQLAGHRRRLLVLGDMLELGEAAEREHRDLGRAAAALAPDLLLAVGAFAPLVAAGAREAGLAAAAVETAADADAAAALLAPRLAAGDLLLLKGSRGVRLERVLARLREAGAVGAPSAAAEGAA